MFNIRERKAAFQFTNIAVITYDYGAAQCFCYFSGSGGIYKWVAIPISSWPKAQLNKGIIAIIFAFKNFLVNEGINIPD